MRTLATGNRSAGIGVVLLVTLVTACSNPSGNRGAATLDMSFSRVDAITDLYRASRVIVDATIVSGPTFTPTDITADAYPGVAAETPQTVPLATKYAVFDVHIRSVLQKRLGIDVPARGTVRLAHWARDSRH